MSFSMDLDLNLVWQQVDDLKQQSSQQEIEKPTDTCKGCKSTNIIYADADNLCGDCGLVINSTHYTHTYIEYEPTKPVIKRLTADMSKLAKMQTWYMWTNEEKNSYKLKLHTKALCSQLGISESLVPVVCDVTETVMNVIKKHEGTKRARVKDGIILACIQYVCNDYTHPFNVSSALKQLNMDIKYVTRAENTIIELTNSGKLCLDKHQVNYIKHPIDYIKEVVKRNKLHIPDRIMVDLRQLIDNCTEKDLLLDHTPLSTGVCCLYYTLKKHNIEMDIKHFSEMFSLSVVSIVKTYNKLKSQNL